MKEEAEPGTKAMTMKKGAGGKTSERSKGTYIRDDPSSVVEQSKKTKAPSDAIEGYGSGKRPVPKDMKSSHRKKSDQTTTSGTARERRKRNKFFIDEVSPAYE
jgi:hypothetical protein